MNETEKTREQVRAERVAKYGKLGSFPYPEIPAGAAPELIKEIEQVRGQSRRDATAAVVEWVKANADMLELTSHAAEALSFLTTERASTGRPAGTAASRESLGEKVKKFFLDPANQVNAAEQATPGQVAAVVAYIRLDMDPKRVLGAWKRHVEESKPEERYWLSYDAKARVFNVEGEGAMPPVGWEGYVPLTATAPEA